MQCRLGVTVYTDLRVATRLTVRTAIGYTAITVYDTFIIIYVCPGSVNICKIHAANATHA